MELDRENRRLEMGPEWGTRLAERMMATERKFPRQMESDKVRTALAEIPPVLQDVKLKEHNLEGLDSTELWELTRKCHLFRSIDLSGWKGVSVLSFRSLCLAVGASLQTVDLSRTDTTNEMLEIFAARLFCLRTINLASCRQLTNLGVRALVEYCKSTLTSIDLSDCTGLNDEAVACLGGAIGFGTCSVLLQSLSLADCKRMSDVSLVALARGCKRLRFLNLSGCDKVTTKGVKHIARGCPKMAVLNLYHCGKVQDGALFALGKHCPGLLSLNVALVGSVTDAGVSALSRGCSSLQALNIAGAKEVTERGVCSLAQNCAGLHTLNMTGCVEVGLGGLHGLISGVGEAFVKEAKTFFGFVPRRSMIDRRVEESQKAIERAAAVTIQRYWKAYRKRLADARRIAHARADGSACVIQTAYYRYRKKMAKWEARLTKKRTKAAIEIQRVYRAHRVRLRANVLRRERSELLAKGSRAVPIQAIFRGYMARRDDGLLGPAIEGMLQDREQELQHAAAVRLQATARAWIAHKKCTAWGEVKRQRMRDTGISSSKIQAAARCFLARTWWSKIKMQIETKKEIERRAVVQIQSFWRGCIGKQAGAMAKSQNNRIKRARHRTAIKIQAAFRGHRGRGEWRKKHREWKKKSRAARRIQKVFRGSRVMGWRDVRLNKVALHVFMRQEMEFQERLDGGRARYQHLVFEAGRDSCSEDDEADELDQWEEIWEEGADHSYWWNAALRELSPVKPLAFEESLVGMRVWLTRPTSGGETGQGKLTRFNRKRVKHRLEFDGGGRKWMTLDDEQDTMMVETEGAWVQLRNYIDPAVAEESARKEVLSRRRRANQHLFDREARWQHVHDEATGKLRYCDPLTGDIVVAMEDAEKWTMEQDDVGDIIFVHRETQEVVYDDPRFEDGRKKERARAKLQCLEDTRFARYFCDQLCDQHRLYEEGRLDAKGKRMFLEALASGESALKMSAAVSSARLIFRERELDENAELQAAMVLGKHMNALKMWALQEIEASASQKNRFLAGGLEASLAGSKSSKASRIPLMLEQQQQQQQQQDRSDRSLSITEGSECHANTSTDEYDTYYAAETSYVPEAEYERENAAQYQHAAQYQYDQGAYYEQHEQTEDR